MAYLQTPPEAGPSIAQATSGLQNWKCAGRRLVEIGGRLPTATQLHQSFVKNQDPLKAFGSKQEIKLYVPAAVEHYTHDESKPDRDCGSLCVVEVTLIQYATVAGHFPGVNASSVKPKPKKANKVEATSDEPSKGDTR